MLLHLPIAMMAMLSPIAASDKVPAFSIVSECRFESESTEAFERCSKDEAEAFQELQEQWAQFVAADKRTCLTEVTSIGGIASYVELLVCLTMESEVRAEESKSRESPVTGRSPSMGQVQPELRVGDESDPRQSQEPVDARAVDRRN
ncbi:MAG: hypothetical protein P4M07_06400 [Xanthobacteraceae bacterium]|nr:hypothetical protein [Xanthobacteraceae bacterium]